MNDQGILYYNGVIMPMSGHAAEAIGPDAVATHGEKIIAVGTMSECRTALEQSGASIEQVDLEGATLLPGFIDTHLHPLPVVFFAMNAQLDEVYTPSEMEAALRPYIDAAEEDEWVVGLQFPPANMPNTEVNRHLLDGICPDRPLVIYTRDGHSIIANSMAIDMAKITADTPQPLGGKIVHDTDGSVSGVFRETAVGLVLEHMPLPNMMKMQSAVKDCFYKMVQQGITSIGAIMQSDSEGPGGASAKMESLAMQFLNTEIPQSLYCIIIGKTLEGINAMIDSPLNDGKRNVTKSFKIFADGTFGSCTACMSEPYRDAPDKSGYMTIEQDDLYGRMVAAHRAGYQICIHAIGDRSIIECLDMYERLLDEYPRADHRHRLEHASLADEHTIQRMAKLGIVVSSQPMFIRSEHQWLTDRLGEDRCRWTYPFRSMIDHGVHLAGSSDAPIERTDVLEAIHVAVTRDGFAEHQCITPYEALRMYTVDAAYAQFQESEKGTIEVGKRADLVVLSQNPVSVAEDEIPNIKVLRTIIDGVELYNADKY